MKNAFIWALIFLLTVFSVVVFPGYDVYYSDHIIWFSELKQMAEPSLYPNDFFMDNFSSTNFTLFDEIFIALHNFFNMDFFVLIFIITFITRYIFFYSIYKLSFYFTKDRFFSILSIFFFMSGFVIYQTASSTMEKLFLPRILSMALGLLFMSLYFEKKTFLSTIPLGLSLIIHPLTAIVFLGFFYLDFLISKPKEIFKKENILSLLSPFIFLIMILLSVESTPNSLTSVVDPIWKEIIRFRTPSNFIASWGLVPLASLLFSLILLIIVNIELKNVLKSNKKQVYIIFILPVIMFIISFIVVDLLNSHLFIELQFSRGLLLWKIFIPLFFSFFIYQTVRDNEKDIYYNLPLIGMLVSFIIKEELSYVFFPMFFYLWIGKKLDKDLFKKKSFAILIFLLSIPAFVSFLYLNNDLNKYWISYTILILALSVITTLLIYFRGINIIKRNYIKKIIFLTIVLILVSIPSFSINPSYYKNQEFMEACNWLKQNTNLGDLLLTEPFSNESGPLRLTCDKKIFTSFKEGGKVLFRRDNAIEWMSRYEKIKRLETDMTYLDPLVKENSINYIFSDSALNINYPLVYSNGKYFIYKTST